jgi:DNA-binding beta-propeller fold protein YncE
MQRTLATTILAVLAHAAHAEPPAFGISFQHLASIATDSSGSTGAEIVAYDARTRRAFAINSTDNDLVVLDLTDPSAPILSDKVSLNGYGAGLNSVDVHEGLVAVAVEANPKTSPGQVVFIDAATLAVLGAVTVGALPDMLTFDADGRRVLVANEGEPNSYGQADSVNPEGSVSIIELARGVRDATVRTADFRAYSKEALRAKGVRVFGPGATAAQDLEPEYITLKGRTAWVTLQEANAIAIVDIPTATVSDIVALGLKDHMAAGNALDASDRDGGVNIANWPVRGMYQPDAIDTFKVGNTSYLITANEGDSRRATTSPVSTRKCG